MKRGIIEIDESLCDGCSQCVTSCAEGAIKIVNGKAKLISDSYCDGLGACIGHCPTGALKIIQREAVPFDESLVEAHIHAQGQAPACGCPSQAVHSKPNRALNNWPLQIMLAPEKADYYENAAGLLIVADCVAFSKMNFHENLVRGKTLLIGCPKLDDTSYYAEKLARIFASNEIKSITIARMEVPCCRGLTHTVRAALALSKLNIEPEEIVVSLSC
ncbi:MAG TPA: 4Fe-4S ferredoxin [Coxiellaceae bacterium]|nr:MAG: hypothetical protein A2V89_05060 [Gammaproteobacteria bacterium RBG_16_37_9]HBC71749.1 4Fe-4S ferredoxin [Coxiellaceae bacterium]